MFEKFTDQSRRVMSASRQEAQRLNSEFIGTEHILLALLREGGVAGRALRHLGVDTEPVERAIREMITPSSSPTVTLGQLPFSPRAMRVVALASAASSEFGHQSIDTEHLLLGILRENEGIGAQVLAKFRVTLEHVRDLLFGFLPKTQKDDGVAAVESRPMLSETLVQLLLKRRNVALVGPPGVGKSSLVVALAQSSGKMVPVVANPFAESDSWSDPRIVRHFPEGELLVGARLETVARVLDGPRLIVEFRPEGFEAFARRFPQEAPSLVPLKVGPPGEEETWLILNAARTRLLASAGFMPTDAVLREAHALASRRITDPMPPWGTIRAMWAAVRHERALRAPSLRPIDEQIAETKRLQDAAVERLEFMEAAALREKRKALERDREAVLAGALDGHDLSMAAFEQAIESLATRGA